MEFEAWFQANRQYAMLSAGAAWVIMAVLWWYLARRAANSRAVIESLVGMRCAHGVHKFKACKECHRDLAELDEKRAHPLHVAVPSMFRQRFKKEDYEDAAVRDDVKAEMMARVEWRKVWRLDSAEIELKGHGQRVAVLTMSCCDDVLELFGALPPKEELQSANDEALKRLGGSWALVEQYESYSFQKCAHTVRSVFYEVKK